MCIEVGTNKRGNWNRCPVSGYVRHMHPTGQTARSMPVRDSCHNGRPGKLSEHNDVSLIWVPGNSGINRNEKGDDIFKPTNQVTSITSIIALHAEHGPPSWMIYIKIFSKIPLTSKFSSPVRRIETTFVVRDVPVILLGYVTP